MADAAELIALEDLYGAHNYHPLDVVISKASGVWVFDVDGKRYLDCLSAYSALNHGHVHSRILSAMVEQAQNLTLTSRAFRNDRLPLFYQQLSQLTGYEMSLPMNSGSEAVETAIKLARKWAYEVKNVPQNKAEIIIAQGNFHGRTTTIVSFSSEESYKENFGPFTPGFTMVRYGDIEDLEKAITPETAAFLVEPIQGEGGVIIPPEGYLRKAKELCQKNSVLFIADEIQTGLGRTGKLFACDHENVRPDIMIIGKALGGGFYPVSATLADRDILGLFQPGQHGSTFGGNPLAAAVASEALTVLIEEGMIENSAVMGEYLLEQLIEISSPIVKQVRGKGLLVGIELKREAGGARKYCEALMERGILCKETHETVIRLAPPLIIKREDIDWALPAIRDVLHNKQ